MNPTARRVLHFIARRGRILRVLGQGGVWKHAGKLHAPVYRLTRGRLGHNTFGILHLLLTTTGRKSGHPRTVPLVYIADAERYVVVASAGGAARHPAWWLNLEKTPRAHIQVGAVRTPVLARTAVAAERERLWTHITVANPVFARYGQIAQREIPVVILEPTAR